MISYHIQTIYKVLKIKAQDFKKLVLKNIKTNNNNLEPQN